MANMRSELEAVGFANVRTILQSGSLIVCSPLSSSEVADQVVHTLEEQFTIKTQALVISAKEFREVIANNPLIRSAESDPSRFVIYLFPTLIECPRVELPDEVAAVGRAVYLYCPEGISSSKLFKDHQWLAFTKASTARNWNTMVKIQCGLSPTD